MSIKETIGKFLSPMGSNLIKMDMKLLDQVGEAIQIMDKDLKIVYYNDLASEISGVPKGEALGKFCYDVLPGKACHTDKCTALRVKDEGKINLNVKKHLSKTDDWIPVNITASPITNKKGEIIGTMESLKDMRKMNSILDSIGEAVQVMDNNLVVTYFNKAAEVMTGIPADEAIGNYCYDVLPGKACKTENCTALKVKNEGRIEVEGQKNLVQKKKWVPVQIIATPLKNEEGEIVGTVESIKDITKVKDKEEELELYSEYLQEKVDSILPVIQAAASGDLSMRVDVTNTADNIGQMYLSFNDMIDNLTALVQSVRETAMKLGATAEEFAASSEELNASADQVSGTVTQIAGGAQRNAAQVENGSKEIKKLSETSRMVAEKSRSGAEMAKNAETAAKEGGKSAGIAAEKMGVIIEVTNETTTKVKGLGEKSKEISKIVQVISNIAEQTNLLALNAAIEAARAGEHGRGFAVVAEEVRKLAEDSSKAAERISDMIKEIQNETDQVVQGMGKSNEEVSRGADIVNEALEALSGIVNSVSQATKVMDEIQILANDQEALSENVVKAIDEIATVTEETAAGAEEASAATEEQTASMDELANSAQNLAMIANDLQSIVEQFKLKTETLELKQ